MTEASSRPMKGFAIALLGMALLAAGCQSYYSGIDKGEGNSYTLTRINRGFMRIYGSVYRCEAHGTSMNCTEIADE